MRTPKIIVDATEEPISLDEARLQCRVDAYDSPAEHPDDPLITGLITAAREWAEKFTGRTIAQKTLELALDQFPCGAIDLPGSPVQSVTGFTYTDGDGAMQSPGYQFDTYSEPPRLLPAVNASWPATYGQYATSLAAGQANAVKVRYVAGYTLPGDSPDQWPLPKSLKQAMLLCIGHWYENREDTSIVKLESIPMGAQALARQYRLEKAMA